MPIEPIADLEGMARAKRSFSDRISTCTPILDRGSQTMGHVLVLYGTTEGQTRRIATVIADTIRDRGHTAELVASTAFNGPVPTDAFDGVIVGGSVHLGRHQDAVVRSVTENRREMTFLPTALFSVSLAVLDGAHPGEAQGYVTRFLDETGWSPDLVTTFAGALRYTKYGFLKRFIMKQISRGSGRPTDTTRDFEFTDWNGVTRFVDRFLQHLESFPRRRPRPPQSQPTP